jgi:hypothetical protein
MDDRKAKGPLSRRELEGTANPQIFLKSLKVHCTRGQFISRYMEGKLIGAPSDTCSDGGAG